MVRKLKGPVKKESKEERRQRRGENVGGKQQILTVALPIMIMIALVLGFIVYFGTRKPPTSA